MMADEKMMMKDDMVTKLAVLLIEEGKTSTMSEALATVLNSETYQLLQNDNAALYYQSPRYVYDFLVNELHAGKAK